MEGLVWGEKAEGPQKAATNPASNQSTKQPTMATKQQQDDEQRRTAFEAAHETWKVGEAEKLKRAYYAAKHSGHPHLPHHVGTLHHPHRGTAHSLLSLADTLASLNIEAPPPPPSTLRLHPRFASIASASTLTTLVPSPPSPPPDIVLSHLTHSSMQMQLRTLMRGTAFARVYAEGRWANGADKGSCLSGWSDVSKGQATEAVRVL